MRHLREALQVSGAVPERLHENQGAAGWPCQMDPFAGYIRETHEALVAWQEPLGTPSWLWRGGRFELAAMTSWRRYAPFVRLAVVFRNI